MEPMFVDTLHGHSWTILSGPKDILKGLGWFMLTIEMVLLGIQNHQPFGFHTS
ncbi:hypothetical protein BHE74_00016943 [Ensete ventricosum]|nr:hypothetical protein GW17_00016795 [Ensete ventricosum]RWW75055.1 hypothetical protein BHE74_00016943 [Ensete ventricosum]RZR95967.1 hypothetical protein BHM03_00024879 [Ensete ventricosum]